MLCLKSAIIAMVALLPLSASASEWRPTQAVKLVVPFAAGGVTDSVARIIGGALQEMLGRPVIIENKTGAGGAVAAKSVAQADPDGHFLFLATIGTNAIAPSLIKDLSYDPLRDFTPIALVTSTPMLLVVNSKSPVTSVKELVEMGRKRSLTFGSSGVGSAVHLANEWFVAMAKLEAVHVAYRGSAQSITDLMAGRLDFIIDPVSSTMPFIASGDLRMLAMSTNDTMGLAGLDKVRPIADSFPGYDSIVWNGIVAPAKTPSNIVETYGKAIQKILSEPAIRKKLLDVGAAPTFMANDAFDRLIRSETEKYAGIIKNAGIQKQ